MVAHPLRALERTLRKSRGSSLGRSRRGTQPWFLESLVDRLLLSGGPTIYTVNSTGNGSSGTGNSGTPPYVIGQADANSNTAGSEIEFDPTVFASPRTIAPAGTLLLSEAAGPEVIDGPGAGLVTVGAGCRRGALGGQRRDGQPEWLDDPGRHGGSARGLSVVVGTVSLTDVAVIDDPVVIRLESGPGWWPGPRAVWKRWIVRQLLTPQFFGWICSIARVLKREGDDI